MQKIQISDEKIRAACEPIAQLLNGLQATGISPLECALAMLFMAGSVMKQCGFELNEEKPVAPQLPFLVMGYKSQDAGEVKRSPILRPNGFLNPN